MDSNLFLSIVSRSLYLLPMSIDTFSSKRLASFEPIGGKYELRLQKGNTSQKLTYSSPTYFQIKYYSLDWWCELNRPFYNNILSRHPSQLQATFPLQAAKRTRHKLQVGGSVVRIPVLATFLTLKSLLKITLSALLWKVYKLFVVEVQCINLSCGYFAAEIPWLQIKIKNASWMFETNLVWPLVYVSWFPSLEGIHQNCVLQSIVIDQIKQLLYRNESAILTSFNRSDASKLISSHLTSLKIGLIVVKFSPRRCCTTPT